MVVGKGGKEAPMGHGPQVEYWYAFKLVEWAKEEKKKAWEAMMESSGGKLKDFVFENP